MEVSSVSMNISARVKKEHGKDTYKKGLPQYLYFNHTISFLFSWQICIILPQKALFFFFYNLTCSGSRIPLLQGYSLEKSSTIILQSIWLYMACNVVRV